MDFSNEHVGSLLEEICGEALCPYFENTACVPDTMHTSDIGYSSVEDGNNSDEDEIHKNICR